MKYRLTIYDVKKWAEREEVLREVEACSGLDRKKIHAAFKKFPFLYFNDLDQDKAVKTAEALKALGVDCEVDSMSLEEPQAEWLVREGRKWVKRGHLSYYHLKNVLTGYGLEKELSGEVPVKAKDAPSLIRTILAIGALLVGLGIILFIASNWRYIPGEVKISVALTLSLGFLYLGYYFRFHSSDHKNLANPFYLISAFAIGGTVLLIGQVYHVVADSYTLPLLWGALVLPVGLFLEAGFLVYVTSGLWFLAQWLYQKPGGETAWFYPVLLMGFLIPYSLYFRKVKLFRTNLVFLMIASAQAMGANNHWIGLVWAGGIGVLSVIQKKSYYQYLLMLSLVFWNIGFLQDNRRFPNFFYIPVLVYFTWQALRTKSSGLMIANAWNFLLWSFTFFHQFHERFPYQLANPFATDVVFYLLATGIFWFGSAKRIQQREEWTKLFNFLAYGGAALALASVYILSFRFYADQRFFFKSSIYFAVTACLLVPGAVLAIPMMIRDLQKDARRWDEIVVFGLICASFLLTFFISPGQGLEVILFNSILFFQALVLMLKGYREQRLGFYHWGIGMFVVLIVSRYFDTFWYFMPRSVFFIAGGIFLIIWAYWIDRQRKKMLSQREGNL